MARDIFSLPFDPNSFERVSLPQELPPASLPKPTLGDALPYFPENPATSLLN